MRKTTSQYDQLSNQRFATRAGLSAATMLLLAACTVDKITTVDEFDSCGADATNVVATFDRSAEGYDAATDPVVLANALEDQIAAQVDQFAGESEWDITISSHDIGIGLLACRSITETRVFYLTAKGAEVSQYID